MQDIRDCVLSGRIRYTYHADVRGRERLISPLDVKHALLNGHHEPKKDKFDSPYQEWNYSIRGKTVDGDKVRIVISFDEPNLIVVTAIRLEE